MSFLILFMGCGKKDDRALVVSKIRAASSLSTAEFILNKIAIGKVGRSSLLRKMFGKGEKLTSFMLYTEATVKAGINLDELKEEDVEIEGTKITLRLPPVKVQSFDFPAERMKLDTIFSDKVELDKLTAVDIDNVLQLAEMDIRSRINCLGLEKTTQDRTRIVMEKLLGKMGFDEAYISFDTAGSMIPEFPHFDGEEAEKITN
jgi:Protein of unknown function (DUF4230)